MASLLVPIVRKPGDRHPTYEFSTPPASRTLLNLDCSADLTPYSRNLGPAVQDRTASINSEVVRAHLEDHREQLLRQRDPVFGLVRGGPALGYSSSTASVPIPGPRPRPQTAQFLAPAPSPVPYHTHAPPLVRSKSPVAGEISTYPPALRSALEESSRIRVDSASNVIYQVIEHISSDYMDDSTDIIGSYHSLHSANLNAAKHFIEEYNPQDEDEAIYKLEPDATLGLQIQTDGSMGGLVTVFVKKTVVKR